MEIQYLKEFVQLAARENFLEAADELFISQSSLSKHIKRLEKELGTPLFDRTTRKVKLNAYGSLLLPYAKQISHLQDACTNALLTQITQNQHIIKLASIPSMPQYGITDYLLQFKQQHPEINFQIQQEVSSRLENLLREKKCDLAFIRELEDPHNEFMKLPFFTDHLTAVLPAAHPLAKARHISLTQLKKDSFLLMPKNSRPYKVCIAACQASGFEPQVTFTTHNLENIIDLVTKGMGIALLMKQLAGYLADKNSAIRIIDIEPCIESHITLCCLAHTTLSPQARAFLESLPSNLNT